MTDLPRGLGLNFFSLVIWKFDQNQQKSTESTQACSLMHYDVQALLNVQGSSCTNDAKAFFDHKLVLTMNVCAKVQCT